MTRFHYTSDIQETVTKALGDSFKFVGNHFYGYWKAAVSDKTSYMVEPIRYDGLWLQVVVRTDWPTLDVDDVTEMAALLTSAENCLRAAGLVEVIDE